MMPLFLNMASSSEKNESKFVCHLIFTSHPYPNEFLNPAIKVESLWHFKFIISYLNYSCHLRYWLFIAQKYVYTNIFQTEWLFIGDSYWNQAAVWTGAAYPFSNTDPKSFLAQKFYASQLMQTNDVLKIHITKQWDTSINILYNIKCLVKQFNCISPDPYFVAKGWTTPDY